MSVLFIIILFHILLLITNKFKRFSYLTGAILIIKWFYTYFSISYFSFKFLLIFVFAYIGGAYFTYINAYFLKLYTMSPSEALKKFYLTVEEVIFITAEEIIWRGIIQSYFLLNGSSNLIIFAIKLIIVSVLFVIVHDLKNPKQKIELTIFSILLSILALTFGNILPSIGLHLGRNSYIKYLLMKTKKI
ncbi:hypothetical protein JCM16816_04710 [Thermoanaerobacter brockii subsp. lactiethylicus]